MSHNPIKESVFLCLQASVSPVERRLLVQVMHVRLWVTCTTLTALYVVPVAAPSGEKPSTMYTERFIVKKITWWVEVSRCKTPGTGTLNFFSISQYHSI